MLKQRWILALNLFFLCAVVVKPSYAEYPRAYPSTKAACYMQLKPSWPDRPKKAAISGEDQPVCRAVLAELNKSCSSSLLLAINISPRTQTTGLSEPIWAPMNPAANIDIIRQAYVAAESDFSSKESLWMAVKDRVNRWVDEKRLTLEQTDIAFSNSGDRYTVYKVNSTYFDDKEINEISFLPVMFIADPGDRLQSSSGQGFVLNGNLWGFRGAWYLIGRGPDIYFSSADFRPALNVSLINDYIRLSKVNQCTLQDAAIYKRK